MLFLAENSNVIKSSYGNNNNGGALSLLVTKGMIL